MTQDVLYFAIGDIHGELARLQELHALGRAYARESHPDLRLVFVHLGDLVDRGPDSYGVVEHIMEMHDLAPDEVITVKGNHEALMLLYAENQTSSDATSWLKWGGPETLESYAQAGHDELPEAHLKWLEALPTIHRDEARKLVFVHGGIHPGNFPEYDERIHMWSRRPDFFDVGRWTAAALDGQTVVHGHTPTKDSAPDLVSHDGRTRINVDTGAVYGGQLTGVMLAHGHPPFFLHA